ncbi:EEF1A lysine methyltransferase 2 [Phyllostomus discolor]|uniref:EEF1A lysine methyltransferase 2 n=1 Tax=Phyllostomus discolor TaxID=89673 RepID=A0A834AF89_9CHIR|nr:EEF1A lysine methyltransferase 2 [Phyllostomus discolor]
MLQCSILELEMVFSWLSLLAKLGFSNITGIDYSPPAIRLSGSVLEKEGLSNIKLKVEDFLNLPTELSGFHVCIDRGTFDAISLNPDNAAEKRKQYVKSLSRVLKVKGFFLITSCNWTKEELLNEFSEVSEELKSVKCYNRNLERNGYRQLKAFVGMPLLDDGFGCHTRHQQNSLLWLPAEGAAARSPGRASRVPFAQSKAGFTSFEGSLFL